MSYGTSLPHRVLRRARRSRSIRRASNRVLARIRSSEAAIEVANRVFAGSERRHDTPFRRYPPAGNLLHGLGRENLPVAVVSLVDVPAERVDQVVDEVAKLQVTTGSFRPLFLMCAPRLDAPRRYGYAAELLIEPARWTAEEPWAEYAAQRVAQLMDLYSPELVAHVPAEGITPGLRILFHALISVRGS